MCHTSCPIPWSSWPKPFVSPKEIDTEAKNEFMELFLGQTDIAQQGLLGPSKYSLGTVWDGYDQLLSLAILIFKSARDFLIF